MADSAPAHPSGAAPAPAATLVRRLLALSWPVVVARATQSVIGFSDALLVSPLGEESLAAVTTGAFNTFCLVILPMGTSFILQSFAAQLRGRGDLVAVRRRLERSRERGALRRRGRGDEPRDDRRVFESCEIQDWNQVRRPWFQTEA